MRGRSRAGRRVSQRAVRAIPTNPRPARSHLSGGFRPQAALASPAIKARTTGSRGRASGRLSICGWRLVLFKLMEKEVDYWFG